jgi:GT2 family glycosyltransferase
MSESTVDIVIATRGRGDLIDGTIESLRRCAHTDFTLWIVDQSDDDATQRAVERHSAIDARVKYLYSAQRGISVSRNIGVAAGHALHLLFTDDDCVVEPDWIDVMVSELKRDDTWAVFGKVIPDENYHPPIAAHVTPVDHSIPMALKDSPDRKVYEGSRRNLGFGHGASFGMRRDRFEQLGGYDELLGVGGKLRSWNDRDIGYRILKRGGRIVYTPAAVMYHLHWRGWEETRRTYRNYATGCGAAAGKYLRCGDWVGAYILAEWLLDQGVRQILSGLLKWHSRQKIEVGIAQLIYPWRGLIDGAKYPIERERLMYRRA